MQIVFCECIMRSSTPDNPYRKQIQNIRRISLQSTNSFQNGKHRRNSICLDTCDNPSSPLGREEMIRELSMEIKNEICQKKLENGKK